LTSALAFLFVLGVLIFVHELGHFLMARRIGVRVLTFSLGFGPKLINVKRGDTEYCISAIPLGGYVKMAGENPEDSRTGAPDEFLSKGKWQRFQVLVMGPIMNLVLAVVVMSVVLYQGAKIPAFDRDPVVIGTFSDNSVALKAGLKAGDRIVTVDGKPVDNWDQFANAILPKASREVNLGFIRDGKAGQVTVVPAGQGKYELGDIGVQPKVRPQVMDFGPDSPAAAAGLQPGDVILSAGDQTSISHAKGPLADSIQRELQAQIDAGRWQPGQRLGSERSLAMELGVSRSSLRQALAMMEQAGAVRRVIGRGIDDLRYFIPGSWYWASRNRPLGSILLAGST